MAVCRKGDAAAFAESDAACILARAIAAQEDAAAVFLDRARLAVGELDRLLPG